MVGQKGPTWLVEGSQHGWSKGPSKVGQRVPARLVRGSQNGWSKGPNMVGRRFRTWLVEGSEQMTPNNFFKKRMFMLLDRALQYIDGLFSYIG